MQDNSLTPQNEHAEFQIKPNLHGKLHS